MKMVRMPYKPHFGGAIVEEAVRPRYMAAQGKSARPVKTPGLHGSRTPGMKKK